MKQWKKVLVRFGCGVLGLCTLIVMIWVMPFPIEGNWEDNGLRGILRFENGKILVISKHFPPPFWIGSYQKKGWGKYEAELWWNTSDKSKFVIQSTFFRMNTKNDWLIYFTRDLAVLDCQKILNAPENEWVTRPRVMGCRVLGTADERLFARGNSIFTQEQETTYLNELLKQPVPIYTASNDTPACVTNALTQNGFDYQIHPNQQWIMDEWESRRNNPDANPLWTNHTFKVIIKMSSDDDKEDDPEIYFFGGGGRPFEYLKRQIEYRRKDRETAKNEFYLYVKDGSLPEDVRQMFDQFDIEYTVLDERVLYRGKRKDPYAKKDNAP